MSSSLSVEIRSLYYSYPASPTPTLVDVNLSVEPGEFVILTGPSGCGKTTLCRCLNGLIPNFYGGEMKGEVRVVGLSVKEHTTGELAQYVGFVFQNPENQLFALSVEKDIAFGLENLGIPREEMRRRVDWAMDIVGISQLKDRAPFELSGGQQQRAAIACVLAMQPKIMVLDEPTSFLDPVTAGGLFNTIKRLNLELKITIIIVEHRLDLLSKYADRVVVMDSGRIVADGCPKKIFASKYVESVGIGVPKIIKLHQMLQLQGFNLGDIPLSVEEFADEIRRKLTN